MSDHGNKVPLQREEIMFKSLADNARSRWLKVETILAPSAGAKAARRKAVDEWLSACDAMLQFVNPGLYDADGMPLK